MKSKQIRYLPVALVVALVSLLSSASIAAGAAGISEFRGAQQAGDLVGTWVTTVNGREVEMVFGADGSMAFMGKNWTYSVGPGKLYVTTAEGVAEYNMQYSGNSFVLSGGDLQVPLTFTRTGGAQQSQGGIFGQKPQAQTQGTGGQQAPNLVGTWVTNYKGTMLDMVLNADGSMTFAGNNWTYTATHNTLVVNTAEGPVTYNMAFYGDRFVLTGGDITEGSMEFTRKTAGQTGAQQTQGGVFGQKPQTQTQGTGGQQAPNLVGTWVTNYKGTMLDMVLNADGSMTFAGNNWTYTATHNTLVVNTAEGPVTYNMAFYGDRFVLTGGDITEGSMEFTRKTAGQTGAQQTQGGVFGQKPQTQTQGSGGQQAPNLVGTWTTIVKGQALDMVLNADGSMTFAGYNWTYTATQNTLVINTENGPVTYNIAFHGNRFVLTGGDITEGSMEFTRKTAGGQPGQPAGQQPAPGGGLTPESIAGYWVGAHGGQTLEMWIDEGGYLDLGEETWSYQLSGGQLIVDNGTQKIAYNIQLAGNTLTLSGGDIQGSITFRRSEEN